MNVFDVSLLHSFLLDSLRRLRKSLHFQPLRRLQEGLWKKRESVILQIISMALLEIRIRVPQSYLQGAGPVQRSPRQRT